MQLLQLRQIAGHSQLILVWQTSLGDMKGYVIITFIRAHFSHGSILFSHIWHNDSLHIHRYVISRTVFPPTGITRRIQNRKLNWNKYHNWSTSEYDSEIVNDIPTLGRRRTPREESERHVSPHCRQQSRKDEHVSIYQGKEKSKCRIYDQFMNGIHAVPEWIYAKNIKFPNYSKAWKTVIVSMHHLQCKL